MTVLREYAAGLAQPAPGSPGGPGGSGEPRYDEVIGPDGALRPAWKGLAELAVNLTAAELSRVDGDLTRALADDGVFYSRPGQDPEPWRLDPVPLVIDAASWSRLEVGLAQRAELLNAMLIDLYGPQRLLSEGVLPPAVVLGHPGFVRGVARRSAHDPRPLVLSATDLGRDAEGEWRVLADRTQAPSGLGYALQNRRVLSRMIPSVAREAGIHRIEPFVAALRSALLQSASDDRPDPRVVVLSPGGRSETAYDQSFLASALGFPLVQGRDLVVRDGWVQMRAFGRLERVDVILRRVDSAMSDALELRSGSTLGVAGLTEAGRRGRVRVVNGVGAGVLENPALLPFMPAVSEALLGESLRLESTPTWWCGAPDGLERVLDRLDQLVVRAIDTPGPLPAETPAERAELIAAMVAAPHRYVGQEQPVLSQAPTWSSLSGAQPRSVKLRSFVLRYGSAYRPLVGGLASVLDGEGATGSISGSKDVWVLKADPTDPDQGLAQVLPMTYARASTGTVPRTLEAMYWFGRYAERAEDLLRLVIVSHSLAEGFRARPRSTGGAGLDVMMVAVTRLTGHSHDDLDAEFRSVLLDRSRRGSVAYAVDGLRDALASIRDQLSTDVWRAFGTTERASAALSSSPHSHQVAESAGRMLTGILSLQGVTASMIRDAGWHMIAVGRHLERAIQLTRLLAATATVRRGIDVDREVLDAVLRAAESSVTHRRRYRGYVRVGGVLELLIVDAENPRSLTAAMAEVETHLVALPASTGSTRPERLVAELREELAETDVATLVAIGGTDRPNLIAFLERLLERFEGLAEAIAQMHLTGGPAPRNFGALDLVDSFPDASPEAIGVAPAGGIR